MDFISGGDMEHDEYVLKIDLNVLDHLGINLYSNVPAVLTELVANGWDADAKEVRIKIETNNDHITIEDDGIGMTPEEINSKLLTVGYRRRDDGPNGDRSPGDRP